jgi:hypothetical protein
MMDDNEFEKFARGKLIDPPSGWLYGFPKVYNPNPGETLQDFLVRSQYPKKDVDFAMKYMRVIGD